MSYDDLMQRAISLADVYRYTAKPNPVVGAIILKDDLIISEGAHENFGSAHAEINAINRAKKKIGVDFNSFDELTLVCTLEPCNHSGKTGPCSQAIIDSGIKKVIIGCQDPNPKVSGTGIQKLLENGIETIVGVCEKEIMDQNKFFFFKHLNERPFISVKIASSKDGKSHNRNGSSTWITCKESRKDVQLVRALYDAILTGGNTLIDDNPRMNARVNFASNKLKKILLTNKDDINFRNNFFIDADVDVIKERSIKKIVKKYATTDINSILVEAGPKLVNSFLSSGLVDELIIYESPNKLGSDGVNWFDEDNAVEKFGFNLESTYKIESDIKKIYKKC